MNPVLLASGSALASAAPENSAVSASADERGAFSLPQLALNAVAERVQSAKTSQQQRQQDNDPAAMQALMALFLAQPTSSASALPSGLPTHADGEMLNRLAAAGSGNSASSVLRQLANAAQQNGTSVGFSQPNKVDLSSLPATLQSALTAQGQGTPDQQAKFATFSAQNLRSIAPEQATLSTSQQISAQARQTPRHVPVHPLAVKKNDSVNLNTSMPQDVLNVAAQSNQPASAVSDQTVISAHRSQPVALSMDELGEKLTALLKDRIQFQLGQQQQVSTIRLDPPSLGKLEIAVQLDAGKLMVHIGANQSDVCRSLQQFSEDLRQHLTAQNFMEVNVQVSSEGQSQHEQQQQPGHQHDEVMSALLLNDDPQYQQHESVLIKV